MNAEHKKTVLRMILTGFMSSLQTMAKATLQQRRLTG